MSSDFLDTYLETLDVIDLCNDDKYKRVNQLLDLFDKVIEADRFKVDTDDYTQVKPYTVT